LETSETSRDRPLGDAASARIEDIRKQWSVLPESGTMNEQEVRQVVHIARTHIAYLLGIIDSRSSPPREEREP
jgi:hypothetical protein